MAGYLARYRAFVVPSPPQPGYGLLSRSHRSFQIDPQPLWLPPLLSPPSTLSPETLINPRKTKIPKKERERTHERLLEHKWLLDQEHERRFRRGMAAIMADVLEFQMASAWVVNRFPSYHFLPFSIRLPLWATHFGTQTKPWPMLIHKKDIC